MLLNSLFKHWSYRLFAPGVMLRDRYEALKRLLNFDILCHEQMAEFQEILHGRRPEDPVAIRRRFAEFSAQVAGMVDALETMAPGSYASLKSYHKKFDFYTRFLLAPPKVAYAPPFVLTLEDITSEKKTIGNKAKNLAILQNELKAPVPKGYAVTTDGYHYFIEYNDLRPEIDRLLAGIDIHSPHSLSRVSLQLTELVREGEVPAALEEELVAAYDRLIAETGEPGLRVAVRSSAIIEDSNFSFAGQYATLLNVAREEIGDAYREVLLSKYSPEALFYRISHGLGDEETAMSVLVQEMVDAACSGVLYTREVQGETGHMHLHVIRGLGASLVGGLVRPEEYVLARERIPTLVSGCGQNTILDEQQAVTIARYGMVIEGAFTTAQDIEWAIDDGGDFKILQARPLHIPESGEKVAGVDSPAGRVLLKGFERASSGVAAGEVYQLVDSHTLEDIPEGVVLVSIDSPPEYVKILNRPAAVVAERGSRASHFATVAREFGVPFLTGIKGVMDSLRQGAMVTVDGDRGIVYEDRLDALIRQSGSAAQRKTRSRILNEAVKFITPLELVDASAKNFTPEGCRSMHDIVRFCHEKALHSMFTTGRPGTGRGALRLVADIPLDVFLFDVGGGFASEANKGKHMPLEEVVSIPFKALWKGLSHPEVQWKQKPFDWEAYDRIELAGGVPPKKDSFAFASYAVISADYLHFNIRFGYHFTIVDVLCGENSTENYCMLRFAGGGGDFDHRLLRIDFIVGVLSRLGFAVEKKGDLLEARLPNLESAVMLEKLDMLGRLLGATKLMDMVLEDPHMVAEYVEDFFNGRYSFSQEG